MRFDIVTFGSAVVDVFVYTDIAEKRNHISYPVGEKILIRELRFDVGGGGTNTAVAFSRLGLKTGYIGKIGSDTNGDKILQLLENEGIFFLGKRVNGNSGYSIVLDSKAKDRTILTYKGVNDEISIKDIKSFETDWVYYSSLLGRSFETQKELAIRLRKKGTKIAFNPSSYLIKKRDLRTLLKNCEIIILNKEEAEMLTKEKDVIAGLHRYGPNIVVVTNREKEIIASDRIKRYYLKPHKIKVVERTGAGDAFASGFVAGIIVGMSISDSLKLGLEESESVIQYFGAKNKLIKRNLKSEIWLKREKY
ncbi:MAG: carbohydrate kinase family protein [Candidatus Pacearchaeota archaeon]